MERKNVNMKFMVLGLLLKLKELFGEGIKYEYLRQHLSEPERMLFNL